MMDRIEQRDHSGAYESLSDISLMRHSRRDAGAFDELYLRSARGIWVFFESRTRDGGAATDLTAETFARAWASRLKFSDEAAEVMPWLYGIARNVLLESVRRQRLERTARDRLGITFAAAAVGQPEDRWVDGLDDALSALPTDQRDALTLRFADDLAYAEIAQRLSITPVAARSRVHRGLNALRDRLALHSRD
jgi:RNA polymerase sigma-70 factor (ECF subfamily)